MPRKDSREPFGRRRGPVRLGNIIKNLVPETVPELELLEGAIHKIIEPEFASEIRVVALRRGTAIVETSSCSLLHELRVFRHEEILQKFQKITNSTTIKKIVYRLGAETRL